MYAEEVAPRLADHLVLPLMAPVHSTVIYIHGWHACGG